MLRSWLQNICFRMFSSQHPKNKNPIQNKKGTHRNIFASNTAIQNSQMGLFWRMLRGGECTCNSTTLARSSNNLKAAPKDELPVVQRFQPLVISGSIHWCAYSVLENTGFSTAHILGLLSIYNLLLPSWVGACIYNRVWPRLWKKTQTIDLYSKEYGDI